MPIVADKVQTSATIRTDPGAIFISLELSRSTWLITSLSPGSEEKMSKHLAAGSCPDWWCRWPVIGLP